MSSPSSPGAGGDPLEVDSPPPDFLQEVDDDWQVLLTADWELAPASEGYYCARATLTEDVYFNATVPLTPQGTHHTLLTAVPEPSQEDGFGPCQANTNGSIMLGGSGVGTAPINYPDGVAIRVSKGTQLLLNLHLFNPTEEPLRGRSGTLVKTLSIDEVDHVAEALLAGTTMLEIPPGRTTVSGTCTLTNGATLVAVSPHMHQLGVHMNVVAHSSEVGDVTLRDGVYDFEEQTIYPLDSIPMAEGDTVEVACTYENDTGSIVRFGDSSLAEMCFAGLAYYPVRDERGFVCVR